MKWADWQFIQPSNWNGADNGVLQLHILKTVMPEAKAEAKACDRIWHRGTNYETYMAYVTCVKINLGATRLFPGKIRIYKRGGWSSLICTKHNMYFKHTGGLETLI